MAYTKKIGYLSRDTLSFFITVCSVLTHPIGGQDDKIGYYADYVCFA